MIIAIGIDMVEIARVERLLASKGEHALRKLFTDAERAYATEPPASGAPSRGAGCGEGGGVQGAAGHARRRARSAGGSWR